MFWFVGRRGFLYPPLSPGSIYSMARMNSLGLVMGMLNCFPDGLAIVWIVFQSAAFSDDWIFILLVDWVSTVASKLLPLMLFIERLLALIKYFEFGDVI